MSEGVVGRRYRAFLVVAACLPALAMCGTDEDGAGPETMDGGAEAEGTGPVSDAFRDDAVSVDAPLDGAEGNDAGDAGDADATVDADANTEPSVLSFLAFCSEAFSGGVATVFGIDDVTGALLRVDQDPAEAGVQDLPAGMNTIFSATSAARGALYCARSVVAGLSPSVGSFAVGDGGMLSSRTSGSIASQPVSLAVHPSGSVLYAIGGSIAPYGLYSFPVAANGGLSASTYAGWADHADQVAVDRLGRFVFAGGTGELWVHHVNAINAQTLTLAPFHLKDGGGYQNVYVGDLGSCKKWTVHPSVDVLYGAFGFSNKLVAFAYNPTTGAPTKVSELPADNDPVGVVVHPNGKHAYVVHQSSATIGHYTIAADGSLSARTAISVATAGSAVTMDPAGKYLYVKTGANLRGYAVATDGSLTALPMGTVSLPGTANDLPTLPKP